MNDCLDPTSIAVAACSYAIALSADSAQNQVWIQITPAGEFRPADDREMIVDHWFIDAAAADRVIARFNARATPPVIDYEHQTLYTEENGRPAPAAGWPLRLEWREGQGLFALVELTATARELIASREYQYFSPVIAYDPKSGEITGFEMGALTNNPAIHGMARLELLAAATFGAQAPGQPAPGQPAPSLPTPKQPDKEPPMNKLQQAVIAALSLAEIATEDETVAALKAHFEADPLAALRAALDQPADADEQALVAACAALKKTGKPNPAEYVSVAVMRGLQEQVAALSAQVRTGDADKLIDQAIAEGRLIASQKDWATELAASNMAALTAYLETSQPIAALAGQQTHGKKPEGQEDEGALSADEQAVCSAMGLAPDAFLKTKKARASHAA